MSMLECAHQACSWGIFCWYSISCWNTYYYSTSVLHLLTCLTRKYCFEFNFPRKQVGKRETKDLSYLLQQQLWQPSSHLHVVAAAQLSPFREPANISQDSVGKGRWWKVNMNSRWGFLISAFVSFFSGIQCIELGITSLFCVWSE